MLQQLTARFDQLPRRDQQALTILMVALVCAAVYFLIWRPVADFNDRAEADRIRAAELHSWMQTNQPALQRLAQMHTGATAASHIADSRGLMSTVTRSARESGLALSRFEPSGDKAMRVWLENVSFKQVAAWLELLGKEYGVVVGQAAFDRRETPGMVSVRLTLNI
ncbi:type II secretion system protein GspM [Marinobacter sp. X15-166B]|uniref:type II secretion system protein GspM n=1 Tax=Marinobacter sp. X15-166B TaxID=1897620 RepID=UPI001D177B1C|nr:type II secretion system protein M [Marinobacter sp. X15-166B]